MQIKFGTDGWRGIIARDFTFDNVSLVAQATMDYMHREGLAEKGMVIGYDRRFLSREFAERVAEIAAGNGIRSWLSDGYAPTPAVSWAVHEQGKSKGANAAASLRQVFARFGILKFQPKPETMKSGSGRPQAYSDYEVARIAKMVEDARKTGRNDYLEHVAKRLRKDREWVNDRVKAAKRRGLFTRSGRNGVRGGELTEKGIEALTRKPTAKGGTR